MSAPWYTLADAARDFPPAAPPGLLALLDKVNNSPLYPWWAVWRLKRTRYWFRRQRLMTDAYWGEAPSLQNPTDGNGSPVE